MNPRALGYEPGDGSLPIDCRCQARAAIAARKLGYIECDHAVALSLSMTHKAIGFDRTMPEPDVDNLDLPPTGTQPVAVHGAARHGGARNQQAPRRPIPREIQLLKSANGGERCLTARPLQQHGRSFA